MHNAHQLVIFHAIRNLQFSQSIVSKKMITSDTTIVSRLYFTYSYNLLKIVQYVWMKKFLMMA